MIEKGHIKSFNKYGKNLNISDVSSKKINESNYKKILIDIDNEEGGYKYYVGYIRRVGLTSWVHDGIFKGFNNHDDVLDFINELKEKGIKSIKIFSPKDYNKIEKTRKQGQ
jgi:predicted HAD superfamily phosphohydrolase YqeG